MIDVAIVKRARIDNQVSRFLLWPLKVDLVGFDIGTT